LIWSVSICMITGMDETRDEGTSVADASDERLPIIGRERALVDALSRALSEAVGGPAPSKRTTEQLGRHEHSRVWPTRRGCAFEVMLHGPPGEGGRTGHVVRVTVELDRFEAQS
jgi:hypothetical protein